jgi:hypothetical protein
VSPLPQEDLNYRLRLRIDELLDRLWSNQEQLAETRLRLRRKTNELSDVRRSREMWRKRAVR